MVRISRIGFPGGKKVCTPVVCLRVEKLMMANDKRKKKENKVNEMSESQSSGGLVGCCDGGGET